MASREFHHEAEGILADWQQVELHLQASLFSPREVARLRAESDRLRREYQALAEEAVEHDQVLPPFPPPDAD